ncbi:hypothetical protein ACWOA5_06480 [Granulicatella adiacens]
MKKLLAIIAVITGVFLLVTCSKPTITKEQQKNVATQIARNYDVNEIEFLSFSKNEGTGSYILKIKINGDENKIVVMRFDNLNKLDDDTVDIGLNPPDKYKNIERKERITGNIDLSTIKIKYLE